MDTTLAGPLHSVVRIRPFILLIKNPEAIIETHGRAALGYATTVWHLRDTARAGDRHRVHAALAQRLGRPTMSAMPFEASAWRFRSNRAGFRLRCPHRTGLVARQSGS